VLIVQQSAETQDGTGFPVPAWTAFARVRGEVKPMRPRELVEARKVATADHDTVIRVRYLAGLDSRMRVLHAARFGALAAAVGSAGATSIVVAEAWPHGERFRIEVGTEIMEVTAGSDGTTWTVTRGVDGTTATTHADGAQVRLLRVYEIEGVRDADERHRELELLAVGAYSN
jgi:head-tail adaptor